MSSYQQTVDKVLQYPLVPVFYNASIELSKKVVMACYNGGIRVFEFTNRGDDAVEVFTALVPFVRENCPDMILGIGTVVDAITAKKYIALGAQFIVQPGATPEVALVCKQEQIPWVPGVMTPTEIYAALSAGAAMVKVFPGNVLGSAYIKSLRGPMPAVKIMVTGGVEPTEASIKEWFGAGANAVGLGSQLFKNTDDLEGMSQNIKELFKYL